MRGRNLAQAGTLLVLLAGCGAEAHEAPVADPRHDASVVEPHDAQSATEATEIARCDLPPTPSIGVCLNLVEPESFESSRADLVFAGLESVTGVVEQIAEADECVGIGRVGSHAYGIRVREGDHVFRYILSVPWQRPVVQAGETIQVMYSQSAAGVEAPPATGSIEIRDADGALVFWLGRSDNGVDWLEPPREVRVRQGSESCMEEQVCGRVTRSTRSGVRVRIDDDEAEVAFGRTKTIGAYSVAHGENSTHDLACGLPNQEALLALVARERVE